MVDILTDPVTSEPFRYVRQREWMRGETFRQLNRLQTMDAGAFYHWRAHVNGPLSFEGFLAEMLAIHRFHRFGRGWFGFAYNLSCADGVRDEHGLRVIGEGRGFGVANGAQPLGGHSLAMVRFESTLDVHPDAQAARLCVARIVDQRYGPSRDRPHRSVQATSCPGDAEAKWIDAGMAPEPEPLNVPQPEPSPIILEEDTIVQTFTLTGPHTTYLIAFGAGRAIEVQTEPPGNAAWDRWAATAEAHPSLKELTPAQYSDARSATEARRIHA